MRKRTKTSLKKAMDSLWSKIIRSKGRCEICGSTRHLNAHHVIGRRALNTRWDLRNGCCLCSGCHTFKQESAHQNPLFFLDWFKEKRPDDFEYLEEKRKEPPRPYHLDEYKKIEKELKQIYEQTREVF